MNENQTQEGLKEPDFHDEQQYKQSSPLPPAQQPPAAAPTGAPSRGLFITASIGMFMMAAIAIVIVNLYLLEGTYLLNIFGIVGYFTTSGNLPIITLILCILLFVAMILSLLGLYGFYKYYRVRTGLATFIYGIVASTMFLVGIILIFVFPPSATYYGYMDLEISGRMAIIGLILFSILLILIGATFIIARRHTDFEVGCALAGILFIFAGAFTSNPYISLQFGYFIFLVAAVVGGLIFLMVSPPAPPTQAVQPYPGPIAQPPPTQMAQPPPKQ